MTEPVSDWLRRGVGDPAPCAIHRSVETHLRCTRCGTPVCPKCLVHTETGARCPRCARAGPARRPEVSLLRALAGSLAGLAVAMAGGALLAFVPFPALLVLPVLLLGLLVGEVVASAAGRPGGLLLALAGFGVALLGPLAGRAVAAYALGGASASQPALRGAADTLGGLGVLLLGIGAVLAAVRAARGG